MLNFGAKNIHSLFFGFSAKKPWIMWIISCQAALRLFYRHLRRPWLSTGRLGYNFSVKIFQFPKMSGNIRSFHPFSGFLPANLLKKFPEYHFPGQHRYPQGLHAPLWKGHPQNHGAVPWFWNRYAAGKPPINAREGSFRQRIRLPQSLSDGVRNHLLW